MNYANGKEKRNGPTVIKTEIWVPCFYQWKYLSNTPPYQISSNIDSDQWNSEIFIIITVYNDKCMSLPKTMARGEPPGDTEHHRVPATAKSRELVAGERASQPRCAPAFACGATGGATAGRTGLPVNGGAANVGGAWQNTGSARSNSYFIVKNT